MSKSRKPTPRQRLKAAALTVPPRNGLVALARGRKAGPHGRSAKAERRAAKVALVRSDGD